MYLHDSPPPLVSLVTLRRIQAATVGLGMTFSKSVQKGQKHMIFYIGLGAVPGLLWSAALSFLFSCQSYWAWGFGAQNLN
jgi:hypothetical protein